MLQQIIHSHHIMVTETSARISYDGSVDLRIILQIDGISGNRKAQSLLLEQLDLLEFDHVASCF